MKHVTIVGIGMGPDTMTQEGLQAIEKADILLGAPRMLHAFSYLGKKSYPEYMPKGVCRIVDTSEANLFAVLVSGDPGFFSAAEELCTALIGCEVSLIPGISSLNYFFARLKRPWQVAALVSCHGQNANLVDTVRRNRLDFCPDRRQPYTTCADTYGCRLWQAYCPCGGEPEYGDGALIDLPSL